MIYFIVVVSHIQRPCVFSANFCCCSLSSPPHSSKLIDSLPFANIAEVDKFGIKHSVVCAGCRGERSAKRNEETRTNKQNAKNEHLIDLKSTMNCDSLQNICRRQIQNTMHLMKWTVIFQSQGRQRSGKIVKKNIKNRSANIIQFCACFIYLMRTSSTARLFAKWGSARARAWLGRVESRSFAFFACFGFCSQCRLYFRKHFMRSRTFTQCQLASPINSRTRCEHSN